MDQGIAQYQGVQRKVQEVPIIAMNTNAVILVVKIGQSAVIRTAKIVLNEL